MSAALNGRGLKCPASLSWVMAETKRSQTPKRIHRTAPATSAPATTGWVVLPVVVEPTPFAPSARHGAPNSQEVPSGILPGSGAFAEVLASIARHATHEAARAHILAGRLARTGKAKR